MKRSLLVVASSLVVFLVSLPPSVPAGKPSGAGGGKKDSGSLPLVVNLYDSVVDEHDTTDYYNNGTLFCSGESNAPLFGGALKGDGAVVGPTTAYEFGSPWTLSGGLSSTSHVDGANCGQNCLRAQLNSDFKILSFDIRGTAGPRTVNLDFTQPCTDAGCPPAGSATVFNNGHLTVSALLNVGLTFPFTDMEVCSSRACPEAQIAFAKLWFDDPANPDQSWRVDWRFLRVLRMSQDTWYVIADPCDGTQIAGLSKLSGKRTRPKETFNGSYKMPFFLVGKVK